MAKGSRQRPQKKKKRSAIYGPVMFVIICAALIFGMSVFFRVSRIEVTGNTRYTAEEVVSASGIEGGDNLFFINRFSAVSRIYSRLPYVETVDVTRYLPNRVVINVAESSAIAYVTVEAEYTPEESPTPENTAEPEASAAPSASPASVKYTEYWAIDRNGKLLTKVSAPELSGLIEIRGLTAIAPKVGEVIAPGEADAPKVAYLAAILNQLQERAMLDGVTWLDISAVVDPSLDYLGRFTVNLGPSDNTEYKFSVLVSAIAQLAEGDRGTIDLSFDKSSDQKAHFIPE